MELAVMLLGFCFGAWLWRKFYGDSMLIALVCVGAACGVARAEDAIGGTGEADPLHGNSGSYYRSNGAQAPGFVQINMGTGSDLRGPLRSIGVPCESGWFQSALNAGHTGSGNFYAPCYMYAFPVYDFGTYWYGSAYVSHLSAPGASTATTYGVSPGVATVFTGDPWSTVWCKWVRGDHFVTIGSPFASGKVYLRGEMTMVPQDTAGAVPNTDVPFTLSHVRTVALFDAKDSTANAYSYLLQRGGTSESPSDTVRGASPFQQLNQEQWSITGITGVWLFNATFLPSTAASTQPSTQPTTQPLPTTRAWVDQAYTGVEVVLNGADAHKVILERLTGVYAFSDESSADVAADLFTLFEDVHDVDDGAGGELWSDGFGGVSGLLVSMVAGWSWVKATFPAIFLILRVVCTGFLCWSTLVGLLCSIAWGFGWETSELRKLDLTNLFSGGGGVVDSDADEADSIDLDDIAEQMARGFAQAAGQRRALADEE